MLILRHSSLYLIKMSNQKSVMNDLIQKKINYAKWSIDVALKCLNLTTWKPVYKYKW